MTTPTPRSRQRRWAGIPTCLRHDDELWIGPWPDEWECQKCGTRRPVKRDADGRARAKGNWA